MAFGLGINNISLENSLLNKVIYSFINTLDDISFETNWGTIVWSVYGDCCSSSWIENADIMLGKVFSVSEIEMQNISPDTTKAYDRIQESTVFYGIEIKTNNGVGIVDFRNSSNGYYGGYMKLSRHPEFNEFKEYWNNIKINELASCGDRETLIKLLPIVSRIKEHYGWSEIPFSLADMPKNPNDAEVWADEFIEKEYFKFMEKGYLNKTSR